MRTPKYKLLNAYNNAVENVFKIELNVMGKVSSVNTGFTTYIIKEDRDKFLFLQETGLKDMHGKPIYERHIVKYKGKLYLIKFEVGSFMLVKLDDAIDMYEEFEDCWNDDVYPLSQLYWNSGGEGHIISDLEIIEFQRF